MKFLKILKSNEYFKIFLKFPINSFLSFLIRFFSLYFFVDILKYNYSTVYLNTYLYILFQSYLIQKYFVQKSSENNFIKFFFANIFLGFFEYGLIYILQLFFNSYYSFMFIVAAVVIYFFRFYIYTFKIFNKN